MRAAPGHRDPLDGRFAHTTRFRRSLVDAMFQLEKAPHPLRIHIIGNRRAAETDCVLQDLPQCKSQPLQFDPGESSGAAAGSKTRAKQALIGIDVPHSGQQCLIEQCRLDR